jgi:hypothetical protein
MIYIYLINAVEVEKISILEIKYAPTSPMFQKVYANPIVIRENIECKFALKME